MDVCLPQGPQLAPSNDSAQSTPMGRFWIGIMRLSLDLWLSSLFRNKEKVIRSQISSNYDLVSLASILIN